MIRESAANARPGMLMLVLLPLLLILDIVWFARSARAEQAVPAIAAGIGLIVLAISLGGFFVVEPNQSIVLMLFGNYKGSERRPGLWWANPFMTKKKITMRVRNFESNKLKVNDHDGNPIEIAAVVVWRVVDTAEAVFEVDDYENYVKVQSEAAVRHLASSFAYDEDETSGKPTGPTLLGSADVVARALVAELEARLVQAGVAVTESRLSHLAYAPEIAQVMLRRQQAEAIIAARQKIVHGAVSMVEMALAELSAKQVVNLDDERKASMVSNLMTVLCAESDVQPVINAGTLYTG